MTITIAVTEAEKKLIVDLLSQCFSYFTDEKKVLAGSINYKLMSK